MSTKVSNQLFREFQGVNGLNPWRQHNSSSREQMFSSHISQTLVVNGATERRCQTGVEREFGKYTFKVRMPCDGEIIKIIPRYRPKIGADSIKMNPQTLVIYENAITKEVGIFNLVKYCSYHQYFGFEYKEQDGIRNIRPGAAIAEGTVFLDSPSITPNGGYKYGVQCNMAFMTHPAVSEDGVIISRDVLRRFAFKTYEQRTVEWGSKRFALNLYGDENNFKPFPDIGDRVRYDGILMCLRSYDKGLAVVEQSVSALMEPDFVFDKITYAAGAGGRIVDIRVQHDSQNSAPDAVAGMETQVEKYDLARREFYKEILEEYNRLKSDRRENLRITPEFHRMVVEALSVVDSDQHRIIKLYRQAQLDDWRVEFTIEYDIEPITGFKLSDCHGGKGVIVHVAEPDEMPVDENGNRADIVMDPNSTISRMNIGRLYEQYINAASRDVVIKIKNDIHPWFFGATTAKHKTTMDSYSEHEIKTVLSTLELTQPDSIDRAWKYLLGYYNIVSPKMHVWFTDGEYKGRRIDHLASVIKDGIYLYMPPENEPESEEIIKQLEMFYKPVYGPVSYIGNSGKRVITKNNVRIGGVYMILLEKTGDDWTAVSSGKLQHFGVLSQVTNTDKHSHPSRQQAIRALGESEVRIYAAYAGAKVTADILDRNNNPAAHKQILYSILGADKPTAIQSAVDRKILPLGGARPLSLVKHISECSGLSFIYRDYKPNWESDQTVVYK